MDIACHGGKIYAVFHQLRLETTLKKMTGPTVFVAAMEPSRVASHESRKVCPRRLYQQVEMILHKGKSIKLHARNMQAVCQLGEKPLAVIGTPEDESPTIATARDMINGVRKIDAWWTCHVITVSLVPTVDNRES